MTKAINILRQFSLPLILGVITALIAANTDSEWYASITQWMLFGDEATILGHQITLQFLVNDIFMVFFFGIAAKEITEACLPGGNLNPIRKALNPLFATVGGVVGPVAVFFAGLWLINMLGFENANAARGWGIPTATDIALAWLTATTVFGHGHPAISFLLLLAIVDDGIGLGIIAIFYGDPANPVHPEWLLLVLLGMLIAYGMRRVFSTPRFSQFAHWWPFVFIAGTISWIGLMKAHLHPALALVFVVPFIPGPARDPGLFVEAREDHSPLHHFEHAVKIWVDFGLFFFAFTNAGVEFTEIGHMTWLIFGSLVIGKMVGITAFGLLAHKFFKCKLPENMKVRELVAVGFISSLGLTVALFVAGAAFGLIDPALAGQAKMGALLTGFVGIIAVLTLRPIFRTQK